MDAVYFIYNVYSRVVELFFPRAQNIFPVGPKGQETPPGLFPLFLAARVLNQKLQITTGYAQIQILLKCYFITIHRHYYIVAYYFKLARATPCI
jgi:hypothetical protein